MAYTDVVDIIITGSRPHHKLCIWHVYTYVFLVFDNTTAVNNTNTLAGM